MEPVFENHNLKSRRLQQNAINVIQNQFENVSTLLFMVRCSKCRDNHALAGKVNLNKV